ncbi:hypothetical protein BgiMline_034887 [Biomphalaria glabrata]|nr:hypothetical protein BgiMline_029445 [Biomphalaria glabrata]
MDDSSNNSLHPTGFIIFLLLLSTLGMVWTVSCSWLTGRKKRQRVGHNADITDGLVLQINRPVCVTVTRPLSPSIKSPRNKTIERYSISEQTLGTASEDLRRSLRLPTIVVTPPSPVDTIAELSSLGSGSSIGKADDLVMSSDDTDIPEPSGGYQSPSQDGRAFYRGAVVRDSMRNRMSGLYSTPSLDSLEGDIGGYDSEKSGTYPLSALELITASPAIMLHYIPRTHSQQDRADSIISTQQDTCSNPNHCFQESDTKVPTYQTPECS